MASDKRYLLDSDVLIGAKNIYYRPNFCVGFWDWIQAGHSSGHIFSIDKVKGELLNGKKTDVLYDWAQRPELKDFFLPSTGSAAKWGDLSRWATSGSFLPAAQAKFLNADSADAWLIAYAAHEGNYTVVTNEVGEPLSKRSIKLPDAANVLNVETISLFDLLQRHACNTFEFFAL
ncbi:DUF4411 family protein [Herbaspirillum frisingense]|uniref:DUF4411 family protein n=1 Tax=Herbaspirillum frisingense TaxID=92645 RepID=A0ABU1PKC1_9BURK|nr:DUF4411 family protein [Herbaspirillum frisingense]MDR6586359.1 hypothetical protein [Herbaspirillum frisingense]